jgi:hypothetical protein
MMKHAIFAAALLVLAACATQSDAQAGPRVTVVGDTTFLELPLGSSAVVHELSITFDAVNEDSRCPSDVQCVWAGNAAIRLTLAVADATEEVVVNSTVEPNQVSFASYTIGYRDLSPYPRSGPSASIDHVARIAVHR